MILKENKISAFKKTNYIQWVGSHISIDDIPSHLVKKNAYFYEKCIIGPVTVTVGDYVLISNVDAVNSDTVDGCDIAKILCLYDLNEMLNEEPHRATVQWYTRLKSIPYTEIDKEFISFNLEKEIVEDHRPYSPNINLETVFSKCSVIIMNEMIMDKQLKIKNNLCPTFLCRYKFVKMKKSYRLVPLNFIDDVTRTTNKLIQSKTQSSSISNNVEFIDINYFEKNKVSPIKILGGRSVVRLSAKKSTPNKGFVGNELSNLTWSPLSEYNGHNPTPKSLTAKRNLNQSLEKACPLNKSSGLNYSIIKESSNDNKSDDIKIKLRVSERRRSTRHLSVEIDPLAINEPATPVDNRLLKRERKRLNSTELYSPNVEMLHTPSKKSKEHNVEITHVTPTSSKTRRKSILKCASSKLDGTPKRNIQLSNIVERKIYQSEDVITTPKCNHTPEKNNYDDDLDNKIPSLYRRSLVKITDLEDSTSITVTSSNKLNMLRSGKLNPAITLRQSSSNESRNSELQIVREKLHVSTIPKSLPCRQKEFNNIFTFISGKIQDQCGGCMYVSGVPGTGKTATVSAVIRSLKQKVIDGEIPPFEFLEINGMRLTEPRQAYVQIYKQLTERTVAWEQAHSLLEKRFTTISPRRKTTVLLVDELDILCNRRQDVVYSLLDWPTKLSAQLVVVTIANTMDLPERLLMGKVTSRLGLTRLTFQPYTYKQLQEIVTDRLSGLESFKGEAVQLVARKVAAVSGDARRALDICRRATEIAEVNKLNCVVKMQHIQQALTEMITSSKVQSIKKCSRIEQIFLKAVVAEVARTGVEELTFLAVYSQVETIAAFYGITVPTPGNALKICAKLGAERLLVCEHSRNDIFQKILLNVSADDIHYALRVDPVNYT